MKLTGSRLCEVEIFDGQWSVVVKRTIVFIRLMSDLMDTVVSKVILLNPGECDVCDQSRFKDSASSSPP